ncbi:MAG TPA: Hsp20/alpha crystallin family protein [Burkholderiaceae bacterium]|nr:Hsp20/alpha crystallin family protein [Burkholderiaceae bacterium]
MFVLSRPATRSVAPQLGRVVDRLFDESLDRYFGGAASGSRTPALDVSETDADYVVAFDVPGVAREQLKVSVEGRRVSLETVDAAKADSTDAPAAEATTPAASRTLYRERQAARYARTVSLPAEVDQSRSHAKFENGVLTLTLAKKTVTGATLLNVA